MGGVEQGGRKGKEINSTTLYLKTIGDDTSVNN